MDPSNPGKTKVRAKFPVTTEVAMSQYSTIINIFHENQAHWIMLYFNLTETTMKVFDSMALKQFTFQKERLAKVFLK